MSSPLIFCFRTTLLPKVFCIVCDFFGSLFLLYLRNKAVNPCASKDLKEIWKEALFEITDINIFLLKYMLLILFIVFGIARNCYTIYFALFNIYILYICKIIKLSQLLSLRLNNKIYIHFWTWKLKNIYHTN